jgi:glycosyltransferase involved in cell wall biosynthesis
MYRLADHIIVHTDRSKTDITRQFNIHARKVSVIGFGVNRIVPKTSLSRGEAKQQLGLSVDDKALLFFGNVLPYKGLEYLLDAARDLLRKDRSYRVVIAGRNQLHEAYWREKIAPRLADRLSDSVICRTAFVRDEEVEVYFKAADVLVLPYLAIFQSAVLFVAYSFGLPVIASDVGAFRDDIAVGKTGYICSPNDVSSLKAVIGEFFAGPLYTAHDEARRRIARYAADKYSWDTVGRKTLDVYLHVTADTQRLTQAR